jgi:hypothetical protein
MRIYLFSLILKHLQGLTPKIDKDIKLKLYLFVA